VEQGIAPPGLPSSTAPLQSLSSPSQVSGDGCTFWLHASEPFVQEVVPAAQSPAAPAEHGWLEPGLPSSTAPWQSLSMPSHGSGEGCASCLHATAPAGQAVVPAAQAPSVPVEHAAPPPGLPLSTVPSQSLSLPSHVSATGCAFAVQAI